MRDIKRKNLVRRFAPDNTLLVQALSGLGRFYLCILSL